MKKASGLLLCVLLIAQAGRGSWTNSQIWNYGNTVYRLKVGDVRRDGHQRIYLGTRDGSVDELSYEQGNWVNRVVDVLPAEVYDVAIAQGRNDSIPRLYLPVKDGHLYELSYQGGIWQRVDMGGVNSSGMNQVALGCGRNDSIIRAYATHTNGHIYEFTWNQGAWNQTDLGNIGGWMIDVAVGITAHGYRYHVYTSSQYGAIYELTYNNGWSSSLIDQIGGAPWGMEIGTISSKDVFVLPLYVTSETEQNVWAYCWSDSTGWQKTSIGHPGQSTLYGSDITLGNGRNDGIERVYQINKDAHVYEFSYDGTQWQTADCGDGGIGWATGITVGRGRDDSLNHVYAGYPAGEVAEYTYEPLGVSEKTVSNGPKLPFDGVKTYPNPFGGATTLAYTLPQTLPVTIKAYDVEGKCVRELIREIQTPGGHQIVWDGKDGRGEALSPGIYFLTVQAGTLTHMQRIVLIR